MQPGWHLQLAGGSQAAVDGGDQHVLPEGGALLTLGGAFVDEFHQLELLGEVVEGSHAAKLDDARPQGCGGWLLEAAEQGVGRAQVLENHRTGAAVHATGFDEIVVGAAMNDFALHAGHICLVYTLPENVAVEKPIPFMGIQKDTGAG